MNKKHTSIGAGKGHAISPINHPEGTKGDIAKQAFRDHLRVPSLGHMSVYDAIPMIFETDKAAIMEAFERRLHTPSYTPRLNDVVDPFTLILQDKYREVTAELFKEFGEKLKNKMDPMELEATVGRLFSTTVGYNSLVAYNPWAAGVAFMRNLGVSRQDAEEYTSLLGALEHSNGLLVPRETLVYENGYSLDDRYPPIHPVFFEGLFGNRAEMKDYLKKIGLDERTSVDLSREFMPRDKLLLPIEMKRDDLFRPDLMNRMASMEYLCFPNDLGAGGSAVLNDAFVDFNFGSP